MSAVLLIFNPEGLEGEMIPLEHDRRYQIGRMFNNDIQLSSLTVSRYHARLTLSSEGWLAEDDSSRNGISINGNRTPSGLLYEGDLLGVGNVFFLYGNSIQELEEMSPNYPRLRQRAIHYGEQLGLTVPAAMAPSDRIRLAKCVTIKSGIRKGDVPGALPKVLQDKR